MVKAQSQLEELKKCCLEFDKQWCLYEQAYIGELMVIERDARRFIYDLVGARSQTGFLRAVGSLNQVANVHGQGRADFDEELLEIAQQLNCDSKQVQLLQD